MSDDPTLSDFASEDPDEGARETTREDEGIAEGDGDRSEPAADSSTVVEGSGHGSDESDDGSGETAGDTGFSTYAWGTYACSRCERASRRVWRADGELVCVECKTW
ncbi:DUF7573 domain-containing protein [Natrinema salsiterrestre]|uniref:DUF7573 domain-containing protein n=1 Tax=Natrinema salsiterrestre TaxID=2950540 RepID=A0A9Q4Q2K2_9EURY|nr:hypothetical protein [Natrinema salsiterrestre]MDF9745007.1 hypothetical protein [Natrinema salsiterrestre]